MTLIGPGGTGKTRLGLRVARTPAAGIRGRRLLRGPCPRPATRISSRARSPTRSGFARTRDGRSGLRSTTTWPTVACCSSSTTSSRSSAGAPLVADLLRAAPGLARHRNESRGAPHPWRAGVPGAGPCRPGHPPPAAARGAVGVRRRPAVRPTCPCDPSRLRRSTRRTRRPSRRSARGSTVFRSRSSSLPRG